MTFKTTLGVLAFGVAGIMLVAGSGAAHADECETELNALSGRMEQQVPATARRLNRAVERMGDVWKRWNRQKAVYDEMRSEGQLQRAEAKANDLDSIWRSANNINKEVQDALGVALETRESICEQASRLASRGCQLWFSGCERYVRLSQFRSMDTPEARAFGKQFESTWRGPEDHNFDPPAEDCPTAAGAQLAELKYGRAFVVRGMKTLQIRDRIEVRPGDIIAVEDASQVVVSGPGIDGNLTITEKTKFEIPDPGLGGAPVPGDDSSLDIGKILQGPDFSIPSPVACLGARG